jgi:hypothetical protein
MPKGHFYKYKKKYFKNLSAIYTPHMDPDPKPCFQAAEGHSDTASREGCAEQGN